jgi:hypothetical protein
MEIEKENIINHEPLKPMQKNDVDEKPAKGIRNTSGFDLSYIRGKNSNKDKDNNAADKIRDSLNIPHKN